MVAAFGGFLKPDALASSKKPPDLAVSPLGDEKKCRALARLLMVPGSSARALAPDGNNGGAHLGDGDVDELVAAHPDVAILGKIRADLLAIDMDGTADWFDDLEEAAAAVGAVRVYLAQSGSPDSLHAVYAPPTTQARRALMDAATRLSAMADGAIDARSPEEWLRLPGSPSLKDGCGPVQPVTPADDGFAPVDAAEALKGAQEALKARRRDRKALGATFHVREFAQDTAAAMSSPRREVVEQKLDRFSLRTSCQLDDDTRRALTVPCPKGADATLHALRAAWHLWRCGYRSWEDVAGIIMGSPALARWRRGGKGEAARRWAMEAAKWASWRPELDDEAAGRIAEVRASAGLLPADLEAVVLAIVEWAQRVGRATEVPIAVRDLVVWGVSGSVGAAHGALEALEAGGVLVRARRWEDGPAKEATLWTLQPATLWQLGEGESNGNGKANIPTHPPSGFDPLHPVWLPLGHTSRRLLTLLSASPSSVSELAAGVGRAPTTVRPLLRRLEAAGMASSSRAGRSVVWSASSAPWGELPVVLEAEEDHLQRVDQVRAEREAWRETLEKGRVRSLSPLEASPGGASADLPLSDSLSAASVTFVADTGVSSSSLRGTARVVAHVGVGSVDVEPAAGQAGLERTQAAQPVVREMVPASRVEPFCGVEPGHSLTRSFLTGSTTMTGGKTRPPTASPLLIAVGLSTFLHQK